MIIFCVIWIPVVAILKIAKAKGNICQVRAQKKLPQPQTLLTLSEMPVQYLEVFVNWIF